MAKFANFLRILSKAIDKFDLIVYNSIKEADRQGGACYKNKLQETLDTAD